VQIVIRRSGAEAASAVMTAIHTLCLPSDEQPTWAGPHCWVAYGDGEPIAFLYAEELPAEPGTAYFSRVCVLPIARGMGLQARLMSIMESRLRAAGISVVLSTTYENVPSANNFIRRGWSLYNPAAPWAYPGTLYWRKSL
jgi:GNAT superfamily N-acetyltransferase